MEINTFEWAPIHDTATLGEALAHLRLSMNVDQRVLAERIGTHRPVISRLENGHAVAQLELVFKILRELGHQLRIEPTDTP